MINSVGITPYKYAVMGCLLCNGELGNKRHLDLGCRCGYRYFVHEECIDEEYERINCPTCNLEINIRRSCRCLKRSNRSEKFLYIFLFFLLSFFYIFTVVICSLEYNKYFNNCKESFISEDSDYNDDNCYKNFISLYVITKLIYLLMSSFIYLCSTSKGRQLYSNESWCFRNNNRNYILILVGHIFFHFSTNWFYYLMLKTDQFDDIDYNIELFLYYIIGCFYELLSFIIIIIFCLYKLIHCCFYHCCDYDYSVRFQGRSKVSPV